MHEKAVLRALIRQARATRTPTPLDPGLAEHLPRWDRIAAYRALVGEPDLEPLINTLKPTSVLLPRIEGRELRWVERTAATEFEVGAFGVEQPIGSDVTSHVWGVDALLIPALAVDISGRRLGQGGGYYDRFLADVPDAAAGGPIRVAVVYDEEVLREIPAESHDVRIDAILTPTRFIPLT